MPWRRVWLPTSVFLSAQPHGQRSLAGYSPQGRKESETTERPHFHFSWKMRIKVLTTNAVEPWEVKNLHSKTKELQTRSNYSWVPIQAMWPWAQQLINPSEPVASYLQWGEWDLPHSIFVRLNKFRQMIKPIPPNSHMCKMTKAWWLPWWSSGHSVLPLQGHEFDL